MLELLIDSAVEAVELTNDGVLAQQTAYDETYPSEKVGWQTGHFTPQRLEAWRDDG
jgi:hypothetical protein